MNVHHILTLFVCAPLTLQGADFGAAARKEIEGKLRSGLTLAEMEWRLKNPGQSAPPPAAAKPAKPVNGSAKAAAVVEAPPPQQPVAAPPPPPPPAPPAPVEVGQSMLGHKRDPLAMIKVRGLVCMRPDNAHVHRCFLSCAAVLSGSLAFMCTLSSDQAELRLGGVSCVSNYATAPNFTWLP